VPDTENERRDEIRYLDNKIGASENLRRWNSAIKFTDQISTSVSKFYVIQYDPEASRVTVEPATKIMAGYENLIQEEQGHEKRDTVFVEIDRAEDLKDAYPNYFLDVGLFADLLAAVVSNRPLAELRRIVRPAQPVPPPPSKSPFREIWRFGRWARSS